MNRNSLRGPNDLFKSSRMESSSSGFASGPGPPAVKLVLVYRTKEIDKTGPMIVIPRRGDLVEKLHALRIVGYLAVSLRASVPCQVES